ncbi:hypothetical protein CBA19CS22_16340 [Caballeronia novacaledonica]|uniref:Uncharacterized protein n=1 Tax=Caballeronia novacaledonica TaxID=1544861 RepID=A0ACB5QT76_9BURK|nr:hypothetical protein CBA19CS22_16340 [Caballeronia novacaledonica]
MTDPRMDFASATVKVNPATRKSERKVFLLDYDGVLHRNGAYRTKRGIVSSDPSRIKLFEYADLLAELLEPYPDVQIVLATTWVKVLGFDRARDALPSEALRNRVVGATYHSRYSDSHLWYDIPRGQQVLRYVIRHRLVRWLALDDRPEGFDAVREHLVLCDPDKALGNPDTQLALAMAFEKAFADYATDNDGSIHS